MKKYFVVLFFLTAPCLIMAQYVTYDVEESITQEQEKYTDSWKKIEKINIYCIQVGSFSGENSGNKAIAMQNEMNAHLSTLPVATQTYIIFDSPNHKVRIGNFQNKMEAYHVLSSIQDICPGAFVTRDKRKVKDIIE